MSENTPLISAPLKNVEVSWVGSINCIGKFQFVHFIQFNKFSTEVIMKRNNRNELLNILHSGDVGLTCLWFFCYSFRRKKITAPFFCSHYGQLVFNIFWKHILLYTYSQVKLYFDSKFIFDTIIQYLPFVDF